MVYAETVTIKENGLNMICPMCKEQEMNYVEYKGTHIYICESCPFIGFEYVEQKDIDNLKEYLER